MTPDKGTKAEKAYQAGKNAYAQGLTKNENPYLLAKYLALRNWWALGFDSLQNNNII